jgi:hypothetical protein
MATLATLVVSLFLLLSIIPAYSAVFSIPSGNVTALIASINQANSTPEEDTIDLEPGIYTLTMIDNGAVPPPFPIDPGGASGLPLITSRIIIRGTTAESTIIERDAGAPAFRLLHVVGTGSLTLSGLTLRGGTALSFPFWGGVREGRGGAVFNGGTLAIDHSILTDNSAGGQSGSGGAIFNSGAGTIINSSMVGNLVNANRVAWGGAIINSGTLTITNSTLADNSAHAAGVSGGAIVNGGTLTITNSTLADNSAQGAISSSGGAIVNTGTITITNSTLAHNSIIGPGFPRGGGGLYNTGAVSLQNTILAQNSATRGPDCFGSITSLDHSLIGDPTDCAVTLGSDDRTGDPGLGEFTDDGTPGNGHFPLLDTSPAIDAGNNDICLSNPLLATDQIGHPRVGVCDIGAIEFSSLLIVGLDVRPGSAKNPVNPRSNGVIPIAILSTSGFDASTVDQRNLRFGPGQALATGRGRLADVNGDGKPDIIFHFRTQESGIQCGDTSVSITGQTINGIGIQGSDSITTVGCRAKHR